MPSYGPVEIRRHVPFPMDPAYRWLTDFDEFDHQRSTGYLRDRRVLDAPKGRARLEDRIRLLGEERRQTLEVDLRPPDRWIATVGEGAFQGSEIDHELAAGPEGGSILRVRYHLQVGLLAWLKLVLGGGEALEEQLGEAWDGVVDAMEGELDRGKRTA